MLPLELNFGFAMVARRRFRSGLPRMNHGKSRQNPPWHSSEEVEPYGAFSHAALSLEFYPCMNTSMFSAFVRFEISVCTFFDMAHGFYLLVFPLCELTQDDMLVKKATYLTAEDSDASYFIDEISRGY